MRNGLLFLAEVTFTASRKNKVWAIFTAIFALTLTLLTLTLNPNDAVTINYSLFLRLAVNVTTAFVFTNYIQNNTVNTAWTESRGAQNIKGSSSWDAGTTQRCFVKISRRSA